MLKSIFTLVFKRLFRQEGVGVTGLERQVGGGVRVLSLSTPATLYLTRAPEGGVQVSG